jgi:hypothetical protein
MHRSIHTIPYNHGGPTRRNNLALTCRRHNQTKAGTGWTYRHNPDGTYPWTTATSHTYTNPTTRPWTATTEPARRSKPPRSARRSARERHTADDPPPF